MFGIPPLGYRAQDGKLVVIESEAEIVRDIFRRYAELGSVRLLKDELKARNIQSKLRTSASGRISGGKPFARGALYLMLQNRIYRRRDRSQQTILSWRTRADYRSAAVGCGPDPGCQQLCPAQR